MAFGEKQGLTGSVRAVGGRKSNARGKKEDKGERTSQAKSPACPAWLA